LPDSFFFFGWALTFAGFFALRFFGMPRLLIESGARIDGCGVYTRRAEYLREFLDK
jgi:hypothetical protein